MLVLSSTWLAGCSGFALRGATEEPLDFLARVQTASSQEREFLWSQHGGNPGPNGDAPARLRRALLQSYPDHRGFSLYEAEVALQSLQSERSFPAGAAVARVRLNEIHEHKQCDAEVDALKQRLGKVADIERKTQPKDH